MSEDHLMNEFHAKIYKEDDTIYIEDMGSINGYALFIYYKLFLH